MASWKRLVQMAVFATVFTGLSLLAHYYVFLHLAPKFGLEKNTLYWSVMVLSSVSFFSGMGITFRYNNVITRGYNHLVGVWMVVFILIMGMLWPYDIIKLLGYRPDHVLAGRIIVGLALLGGVGGAVNAQIIRTRKLSFSKGNIKRKRRIVLLSDIHIGPVHGPGYLRRVVKKTVALSPDLVLMTGDLLDGPFNQEDRWFGCLQDIKVPVYLSPGNHEHMAGSDEVNRLLKGTGVRLLVNERVDMGDMEVIAVDFSWKRSEVVDFIRRVPPRRGKYTVLMSHGPPCFDDAAGMGVDLQLSGHTHGGQFFPFTLLGRIFVKRRYGIHRKGDAVMYVTSGTGTWGPPVRLCSNSEMVIIELK